MNIEQATRLVHILEAKRDATHKAIDSLINLSAKFEASPSASTQALINAWLSECKDLTIRIGDCEWVIQAPENNKIRHLTAVK